jgi:hypothetical protein
LTYVHSLNGAGDMRGTLLGKPLSLNLPASVSNDGLAEAFLEASRLFDLSHGYYAIPYGELGLHFAYLRSNGGRILTGDLSSVVPSAWTGSLRSGVRMQLPNNALLEASAGYLSFGQPGRNVWEGRLRFSLGF